MSVFTAYFNDNAQTPLDRFVVHMLYKQVCYKHSENRTDGVYALVYRTYVVDRRRREQHGGPSSILLIPASSVRRQNFL